MIDDEVAMAMKWARERSGKALDQWTGELLRLLPEGWVLHDFNIEDMEAGVLEVPAAVLVAAARIVEQPVSVILGEMTMYEVTLPALERRLSALERRLDGT